MQPGEAARTFQCSTCGAALPATSTAERVRCAYCNAEHAVPDVVRDARAREALAEVELAVMRGAQQSASEQHKRLPFVIGATLAMIGGSFALSLRGSVGQGGQGPLYVTGLTLFVGAVALQLLLGARRSKRLAALPLARPGAFGSAAQCPNCGSALTLHGDDPTVRCVHCQVESLLPVGALSARAQLRQRAMLAARQQAIETGAKLTRGWSLYVWLLFGALIVCSGLAWVLAP